MCTNTKVFPFFLECSKQTDNPKHKEILFKLAFGQGGYLIVRNNFLVTPNGEFKIPDVYSTKAHKEVEERLWKVDEYSIMKENIKDTLSSWSSLNKRNKVYLLFKYSSQNFSDKEKLQNSSYLNIANMVKLIKPTDVVYELFSIIHINPQIYKN